MGLPILSNPFASGSIIQAEQAGLFPTSLILRYSINVGNGLDRSAATAPFSSLVKGK